MIRTLNIDDLDIFIQIREDSLRIDPRSFGADSNKPLDRAITAKRMRKKNDEDFILAYFEGNEILGMVGFLRETGQKFRHKGHVWGVFVYPDHRRKGIAYQLMLTLIDKARKIDGLQKINLSANRTSIASVELYGKLGFKPYGTERNAAQYEGEILDEVYMDLQI